MKNLVYIFITLFFFQLNAQIGIGTTNPDASSILDINSTTKGVLMPRLTNTQRNAIATPANGLVIFNTDNNQLEYNRGTSGIPIWSPLTNVVSSDSNNFITKGSDGGAYLNNIFHIGKFIINSAGSMTITGIAFTPSKITFTAYANIEGYSIDADNQVGNNNNGIANSFGGMTGYAIKNGSNIDQQCIYNGGSGASINNISRYSSAAHAIGIRYGNQNGVSLGKTTAIVTSLNTNGFTLNVDNKDDNLVVIYQAYK
ncbi:MAG: hypothetical protein COA88_04200 [Kordia sp.]|nr:MAG: hypothetical protein COA88_04200 [Kordia sp.]